MTPPSGSPEVVEEAMEPSERAKAYAARFCEDYHVSVEYERRLALAFSEFEREVRVEEREARPGACGAEWERNSP